MPLHCSVCVHPERPAIDRALIAEVSLRDIAGQYGLSKSAVDRHKAEHLPEHMVKAQAQEDVRTAIDVVRQLKAINAATLAILQEARSAKQHTVALMAIDRVQRQIELQAKLLGELQQEGTTNIVINQQVATYTAILMQALGPWPDARAAAAAALEAHDVG